MSTPIEKPKAHVDPTFTPLRNEKGGFTKVQEPPAQKKLDPSDPDWEKINPDIVALAQRNGMARSALNLYLEGQLNWMEALETMVTALGKELLVNQKILVEVRSDYVDMFNELGSHKQLMVNTMRDTIQLMDGKCKCGNPLMEGELVCTPCFTNQNLHHDVAN